MLVQHLLRRIQNQLLPLQELALFAGQVIWLGGHAGNNMTHRQNVSTRLKMGRLSDN